LSAVVLKGLKPKATLAKVKVCPDLKENLGIAKTSGALAEQYQRMIYNQADIMPYVVRTLKERQQRFLNG